MEVTADANLARLPALGPRLSRMRVTLYEAPVLSKEPDAEILFGVRRSFERAGVDIREPLSIPHVSVVEDRGDDPEEEDEADHGFSPP